MASVTLDVASLYAAGTSLNVYNFGAYTDDPDGTAPPTAVTSASVASNGTVAFTGLADATRYFVGTGSGPYRYLGFSTASALPSGGSGVDQTARDAAAAAVTSSAQKAANLSDLTDTGAARANIHSQKLASVRVVATSNVTRSGAQTIDGVALVAGDRVLLAAQTTGSQNGPWQVAAGAWVRPSDYPAGAATIRTRDVTINEGNYAGQTWQTLSSALRTVDTDATAWVAMPGAGGAASLALSITGGRPIVASRAAATATVGFGGSTDTMVRVLVLSTSSGLRLLVGTGLAQELEVVNPLNFKAGVQRTLGGTIYPVSFSGKLVGTIDPGVGGTLLSDPLPFDVVAGDVLYVRLRQYNDSGRGSLATTAALTAGATTFQITGGLMPLNAAVGGLFLIDSGANAETVTVTSITGTPGSPPYTVNCTALTKAHASGVLFGQQIVSNITTYSDRNETFVLTSTTDYSQSGTPAAIAASTRPLTVAANAGDQTITMAGPLNSPSLSVDTGGSPETVTVTAIRQVSASFVHYLAAPLASAHASGATVATVIHPGGGHAPLAIVADRVTVGATRQKSALLLGDSITFGVGYQVRLDASWMTVALEGIKPYIKVAYAGEMLANFMSLDPANFGGPTTTGSLKRRKLIDVCDWIIDGYGRNDITYARTLSQIQADKTALAAIAHAHGLKYAICTVTPSTTSTDGWATTANQTVEGTTSATLRRNYNAWVRGGAGGIADLILDPASKIDNTGTGDSGLWLPSALPAPPYTVDGLHPSKPGADLMATALNPALLV